MRSLATALLRCLVPLAAIGAAITPIRAQEPAPTPPGNPGRELDALQEALRTNREWTAAERVAAVRSYLQRHQTRKTDPAVLRARLRLGGLHLESFDAESARAEFAAVRELAPRDDHDLRGRALYGLAQAQELHGEAALARETLDRLLTELPGTRYADFARIARNRLDQAGAVQPGQPVPPLQGGQTADGAPFAPRSLLGRPVLLVVFAPDHAPSLHRLQQLQQVWLECGQSPEALIAYGVGADQQALQQLARQRSLRCTLLPCADAFLHPDLLALRVTGVPTAVLADAEHTVVMRQPPLDRLRTLLEQAR